MFDFPFETGLVIYFSFASLLLGIFTFFLLIFKKIIRAIQRMRRKSFVYGRLSQNVFQFTLTILWITVSGLLLFLAAFIQSYQAFTKNELVAEVRCRSLEDSTNSLLLELTTIDDGQIKARQEFRLNGDQWALEGDILKWDDWLNFVGVHTMFKLTRVRGRFVNYQDEISERPSVYSLVEYEDDPRWRWLYKYGYKIRFVKAVYGNTIYTYPSEKDTYEIYVTTSGFFAKVRED